MSEVVAFARLPTISVVVPCYNGARWLGRAIGSALNQNYPALEVIVVDDGSTDDSVAVAGAFVPQVRVERRPHAGACAARNHGASVAKGDLLLFLDADDELLPDALQCLYAAMKEGLADAAFGDTRIIDEEGRFVREQVRRGCEPDALDEFVYGGGTPAVCTLVRRRSDIAWDEDLPSAQEFDYFMRRAIAGDRFVHIAKVVLAVREHASPNRISVKAAPDRILVMGDCWHRFERLLHDSGKLTIDRAALVAYGFMGIAVGCYLEGHWRAAANYDRRVSRRLLRRTPHFRWWSRQGLYVLGGYRPYAWSMTARFKAGHIARRLVPSRWIAAGRMLARRNGEPGLRSQCE